METTTPQCYVPEFVLEGTSLEIGLKHGRLLSKQIESNIAFYRTLFKQTDEWIIAYATSLQERLARLAPDCLEEMTGIAEGSGQPLHWILALNARTEIYTISLNPNANPDASSTTASASAGKGECTLLAVPEEGFLAQTWDWYESIQLTTAVMHVRKAAKPRFITYTEAGIVAKIGLNENGIGVGLNYLNCKSGLIDSFPVHLLLRRALECASLDEWDTWLQELGNPQTSSAVTVVCGQSHRMRAYEFQGARSFEVSAVTSFTPKSGEKTKLFCRANHYLANEIDITQAPFIPSKSSTARFNGCKTLLEDAPSISPATSESLLRILASEVITQAFRVRLDYDKACKLNHGTVAIVVLDLADRKSVV